MIGEKVPPQEQWRHMERGLICRYVRMPRGIGVYDTFAIPKTTIICHGDTAAANNTQFVSSLHAGRSPVEHVIFVNDANAVAAARAEMEIRGDRYLAFVDTRCILLDGWLDELVREIEWGPAIGAATLARPLAGDEDGGLFTADARCTLLALSKFPQHERLGELATLDGAVADFLVRCLSLRVAVRGVGTASGKLPPVRDDSEFEALHGMRLAEALTANPDRVERTLRCAGGRRTGLISIVMLSWNAPQFTKLALESIRAHTSGEYEIIIVDNGSHAETVDWLKTLTGVKIIYNPENRGYAGGNNQAIAAARGEYVVLLNNDVIVTEGWLENLLRAFDRIPGLGVSAPRSNKIAGNQIVPDASYTDIEHMHQYAARRRERLRDRGYLTDRAIGLCLCIDRRVIDEIGGIDERFGVGNFEDDDFCLRVRAAGYRIYVCDDVFIHHFGSQTFAANKVDWTATMQENWTKFAQKWELPPRQENGGYVPAPAIARGFVRDRHYVPLPAEQLEPDTSRAYKTVFCMTLRDERDWSNVAGFARRYVRAFSAQHPVLLAIAAAGEIPAVTVASRLERLAGREGLSEDSVADIEIADATDLESWQASLPRGSFVRVEDLSDRSPSALRRHLREEAGA